MTDAIGDPRALVASYLDAGDRQDFARMELCLAERVVTHSPGGGRTVGMDGLSRSWAAAHAGLQDLHHEILALLVDGEAAAAHVVVTGTHVGTFLGVPATGSGIRVDQALFVTIRSGRIAEIWEVVDTGAGLRQLGVLGDQPLSPGG